MATSQTYQRGAAKEVARLERMESLIPRLAPGTYTALAVLRFVKRIIKQVPTRLDMSDWMVTYAGQPTGQFREGVPAILPRCGTVACAAGWINLATGHREANTGTDSPGTQALNHLGLKTLKYWTVRQELDNLFSATDYEAADVARELDRIMHDHKDELTTAKVTVKAPRVRKTAKKTARKAR